MDDFNAAFGKIDETLKANADAVAAKAEAETVTAIAQTIAAARFAARSSAHTPAPVYRVKITRTASNAAFAPRRWCCSARTRPENDGHTRRDRLLVRHRLHEQLLYMG